MYIIANNTIKDLGSRAERVAELIQAFTVSDVLDNRGNDVLIIDDLLDTGSTYQARWELTPRQQCTG